jgi:hypothetical protein
VRYCSRPTVDSGTRVAAALKSMRGTAVAIPTPIMSSGRTAGGSVKVPVPAVSSISAYPSAGASRTSVSTVRPSAEPVSANFLTSPYAPNAPAITSDSHGGCPCPTVSTSTAAVPSPTATHCGTRSRSRNTSTPSATLTSGLMK